MSRIVRTMSLAVVATVMLSAPAWAQPYYSESVGFNGPPIDPLTWGDYPSCMEMFREPEWSGSTALYVVPNTSGTYDENYAVRTSGFQQEGAAAMEFNFEWVEPNDPDAWVRMTTFLAPVRPNPGLHLGGKVHLSVIHLGNIAGGNGDVGMILTVRETGAEVPMMADGGTSGELEFVGVSTTVNGIIAGPDGIVDTAATGDDVQVYPVGYDIENDPNEPLPSGTAVILPGFNGTIETTPANDDLPRSGYFISDTGGRTPIPAITLSPSPFPQSVVFNLANGSVSVDGGGAVGGLGAWTGDGVWSETRGTLDSIGIVNVSTDAARPIVTYIDTMQFESPVADPVLPPTIVAPIIKDDTSITVNGLAIDVERVDLYKNGGALPIDSITVSPAGSETEVVFTIAAAVTGDYYTATQTGHSVDSAQSAAVYVLPEPSYYSFCLAIDEDGSNCSAGPWELVPCTDWPSGGAPLGAVLFRNDYAWQTVEIPLTDPFQITAWGGYGDGVLLPNPDPNEDYYYIDSFWFPIANGAPNDGPHEVYMDSLVALDSGDNVIATIHDHEDGYNWLQNARGQSTHSARTSTVVDTASYEGTRSLRLTWSYGSTDLDEYLINYHAAGWSCGAGPTFPDSAAKLRIQLLCRSQADPNDPNDALPLPVITAPIIAGDQDTVQIQCDPNAVVQLYINGAPEGSPVTATGTTVDVSGLTLSAGDSVSATQAIGTPVSRPALPRGVIDVVPAPVVVAPIAPGATSVDVTNLMAVPYATASLVEVYVNGGATPVGSAVPAGDTVTVNLSVTLQTLDLVTATQTVNTVVSPESDAVTVSYVAPVIYMAPFAGTTSVRVQDLPEEADSVTVVLNGTTNFSTVPDPNATVADVPVSGFSAGDTITAYYTIGAENSVESDYETVTVGAITGVFNDDMESYADQDDFENASGEVRSTGWWPASGDPCLTLDYGTGAKNATPGGSQSAYCPAGMSPPEGGWTDGWQANFDFLYPEPDYYDPNQPYIIPTETEPLVWNVNIYDSGGGVNNMRQWASLRNYNGEGLAIIAVGMPGSSFFPTIDNTLYNARVYSSPGYINLDHPGAPNRSIGWHTFTVVVKDLRVDIYVDGVLAKKNVARLYKPFDNLYMGSGYAPILEGWYDDFKVDTGKASVSPRLPNPPVIASPIEADDTTVTVKAVEANGTLVTVYANGSPIGTGTPTGDSTLDVTVTPLVHLDMITASQVTPAGTSEQGQALEVGKGNGTVRVCVGVRETGDTDPLGETGGTAGEIEWIGCTGETAGGAPIGQTVLVDAGWQTLTFDPGTVYGFTGDGLWQETRGVLEHLAIAVDPNSADRSSGAYEIYIDNVINVGAGGGGADFVITDFEGFTLGEEVLFQEPTLSGTTDFNLSYPPSASACTDEEGNTGQSELLTWFFKDTTADRWVRITTSGTANLSRPIIDLTKAIRLDMLIAPADSGPPYLCGDANGDGTADVFDIDAFVVAITSDEAGFLAQYPLSNYLNSDTNCDLEADVFDIDTFVGSITGTACDCGY